MKNLSFILLAVMLSISLSVFSTSVIPDVTEKPVEKVQRFSNEEFFSQADIIVETKDPSNWTSLFHSYDAFGNDNRDDIYSSSFLIVTYVYKNSSGISISPGDTINVIREGGSVHRLSRSKEGFLEEFYMEKKSEKENIRIPGYPICFLKKSDYPENPDTNKQNKHLKVSSLQKAKDEATGFDNLHFENRYELYKYMEQFEGVNVPLSDPSKMHWDLFGDDAAFNQYLKERNVEWRRNNCQHKDSLNRFLETKFQKAKENRSKREQSLLKALNANNILTVTIRNQAVQYDTNTRKYYFTFDVYANANNSSTYFDYAALVISYNTDAFGQNISNNRKVEISNGAAFYNSTYNSRETYDITANVVYLCFGTGSSVANPVRILCPTTPIELMKVKIELLNNKQGIPSNISFIEVAEEDKISVALFTPTSNAQPNDCDFYDDTNCHNPPAFTIYTVAPTLSNFTPTTTRAGVGESITINGNNFGVQKGQVLFTREGITSGTTDYLKGLDSTYIESWTNIQIRVKVPSFVRKGYVINNSETTEGYGTGAGTGRIKVRTARNDSVISTGSLNIEYSVTNWVGRAPDSHMPDATPISRVHLARLSNCQDIVFTLHNTLQSNAAARTAIEAALTKWSDLLGLRLVLEKNSSGNYIYANDFPASERNDLTRNVIGFSPDINGKPYKAGNLMVTDMNQVWTGISDNNSNHTYYRSYGTHIYINNSTQINWDYVTTGTVSSSKTSFYTTMLHEIGHVLNLQHVNNSGDLMYYGLASGQLINLTSASMSVVGVLTTVNASLNKNWELSSIGRLRNYSYNCDVATSVMDPTLAFKPYPNPAQNSFFINCESIATIKLYDILGKEVLSQIANGQTEISISHLPKGIYNTIVLSENKITESSKIVKL